MQTFLFVNQSDEFYFCIGDNCDKQQKVQEHKQSIIARLKNANHAINTDNCWLTAFTVCDSSLSNTLKSVGIQDFAAVWEKLQQLLPPKSAINR